MRLSVPLGLFKESEGSDLRVVFDLDMGVPQGVEEVCREGPVGLGGPDAVRSFPVLSDDIAGLPFAPGSFSAGVRHYQSGWSVLDISCDTYPSSSSKESAPELPVFRSRTWTALRVSWMPKLPLA